MPTNRPKLLRGSSATRAASVRPASAAKDVIRRASATVPWSMVGEIAAHRGLTRQRVQQVEADALSKLGVRASIAQVVHTDERADRALLLRARGRCHGPVPTRG